MKYFGNIPDFNTIGIWNIQRKLYIPNGKLKNQAYKKAFYGKEPQLEDALGLLETEASDIIRKIVDTLKLPNVRSRDKINLYTFLVFQSSRTEAAVEDSESIVDQMTKMVFKHDRRVKDILSHVNFGLKHPAVIQLGMAAQMVPIIFDLGMKLIINNTTHEFITSDNPVVRYNQLVERFHWPGSGSGLGMTGLQIFFPLTPRLMLVLYDRDIYRVGNFFSKKVVVINTAEINRLNGLQFLRAGENNYFSNNISHLHIARMDKRWSKFRRPRVRVNEYLEANPTSDSSRKSSLIVTHTDDNRIGLELSFITFSRKGRKKRLGPTMWNPRNKYVEQLMLRNMPFRDD